MGVPRVFLIILLAVIAAGCVSTKKRYQQALEHEEKGSLVQAAQAYIRVLESDRNFEDARDRLADVGARAMTQLFESSTSLEATGAFDLALNELDRMQELHDAAEEVRVILSLPEGFEDQRRFLAEAAVDSAFRKSEEAVADGRPDDARQVLERARGRYEVDEMRLSELDHRLAEVLLELARIDMAAGRHKAGYDTALRAVEILDTYDDALEEAARSLADEALAEGIRTLALVPLWQTDGFGRVAPPDLRADINDAIAFGEAGRRSAFIAIMDPGSTRRLVRAMGIDGKLLTRSDFREIAQELRADFVLSGELTGFERNDRDRRTRTREAKTRGRGGVDTTYTWKQTEIRFRAVAVYRVYDRDRDEFVIERTVEGDARERFERGAYPGNWQNLDLSGSEQMLFDPDEWVRQERGLMVAVSDQLAAQMMREVDDRLERFID